MFLRAVCLALLAQLSLERHAGPAGRARGGWSQDEDSGQHSVGFEEKGAAEDRLLFHCDTDSLIIRFPPDQLSDLYLLMDDHPPVFIKNLLLECSNVEVQRSSLIRIFWESCFLKHWVGRKRPYIVKMGSSGRILEKTCPSSASGALRQVPSVTCGSEDVTVKLSAKELKGVRFEEVDKLPAQDKKNLFQEPGVTQWRNEDGLFVKVKNKRMEDHLAFQYIDLTDESYTAKVYCAHHQPKRLPRSSIQRDVIHIHPYSRHYRYVYSNQNCWNYQSSSDKHKCTNCSKNSSSNYCSSILSCILFEIYNRSCCN
ncbi:hypothetical protein AOLI_G00189250 [Acnodon oligacanthus]